MADSERIQSRSGLSGRSRPVGPLLTMGEQLRFVVLVIPLCLTPLVVYGLAPRPGPAGAARLALLVGGIASLLLLGTTWSLFRRRAQVEHERLDLDLLVRTDPLTGLGNRWAMWEALDVEARRAARLSMPITVLLVGLDRLETVSDRHGHQVGDRLLSDVAGCLRGSTRTDQDSLFRCGRAQFVVVLPATEPDGAAVVARRLQDRLARDGTLGIDTDFLDCSVGIARREADETAQGWFDRAAASLRSVRAGGVPLGNALGP